jgi:hypothetical protein
MNTSDFIRLFSFLSYFPCLIFSWFREETKETHRGKEELLLQLDLAMPCLVLHLDPKSRGFSVPPHLVFAPRSTFSHPRCNPRLLDPRCNPNGFTSSMSNHPCTTFVDTFPPFSQLSLQSNVFLKLYCEQWFVSNSILNYFPLAVANMQFRTLLTSRS